MKRRLCALCVAVLVACASWSAIAGDKEEAKQLFDAGLKLMRLDDFAGASANFERSVALYPTQNSLFNLANCYKALQRYGDALVVIERLKRDFAGKLKPEIKEAVEREQQDIQSLVAHLTLRTVPADVTIKIDGKDVGQGPALGPLLLGPGEHEIEAARPGYRSERRTVKLVSGKDRSEKFVLEVETGQVAVLVNLAGASVFVDGQQVGTTPLTEALSLPPGRHALIVRAADHEDAQRELEVQAGTKQVLDIVLSAKPAPMPVAGTAATPSTPESEMSLSARASATPKSKSSTLTVVTWTSLAGAVVAGVVAGTFWLIARSQYQDFDTARTTYNNNRTQTNYDKASNARADVQRSEWTAIGCGIGAGALAVTALVTYLLNSGTEENKSNMTVSLSPFGLGVKF
ncbi:MAG: PEGA domain-containing protein [Polyangia bacterium]